MHLLGLLMEREFGNMVSSNMIINCPVAYDDVKTLNLFLVLMTPR